MRHITLFLFFVVWQLNFAQHTTADLVYRCDFNAGDPVWKSYNQKAFVSNTVKGKFILQHEEVDQT